MTDPTPVPRRTVLVGAGAAAGAVALAACSSGGTDAGSDSGSAAAGPTASAGATASDRPAAAVVALADVPVGSAVVAKDADGRPVVVGQPQAGTAVAFSAICTHMGCTVAPDGARLKCPCHGSVYEAATGKVLSGPAPSALPALPVHVADGQVVLGSA